MKALNTFSSCCTGPAKWCLTSMIMLLFSVAAFAQPANDDCAGAIAVDCGDVISSTTIGSTGDMVPSCGLFPSTTGVWYSIVGTGADITVSTCSSNTGFDTQLGVFSGSCGSLSCVASNNNDFGCENNRLSTVTFPSAAGVTYYILVNGTIDSQGPFELTIDCAASPIENDDCDGAIDIACDQTIIGSTEGASSETLDFCGTTLSTAPGVWYHFVGTGNSVTVTTCGAATNFDTKIGVFSGSCGALSCVAGDDDEFSCGFSSVQSLVSFSSVAGADYYIYVTGFSLNSGTFELSVTCASAVTNDDACDATPLSLGATPFDLSAATAQAGEVSPGAGSGSSSCDSQDGWCSFEVDVDASLWYTLVAPESGCVSIELDGGDTQLAVWSVGDCSDFSTYTEVAANDDGGPGTASALYNLLLEPGETYYVQVDDYAGGPTFASGNINYSISTECDFPPTSAPTCETAATIDCGTSLTASTVEGVVNDLDNCNGVRLNTAPGVWYVYEGDNSLVTVNTCGPNTNFDTRIGVFTGSCDDLTCLAANDNSNINGCLYAGRASEVSFPAFVGTTYYIYVTGGFNASGTFDLNVECSLINDDCSGAFPIGCGESISATTTGGSPDDVPACDVSLNSAEGVWYTVVGTGLDITASLCGSSYDTKIGVFSGACGALSCVASNDDACGLQSSVTFTSAEGADYYILVTGFGSSDGDFTLSVTCEEPAVDNTCGFPEVSCGDVVTGSTVGAPVFAPSTCTTALNTAGGVWYAFQGTGDFITASLCGSSFDTKIGVFTGSCGDMTCVAGNDDFCGVQSEVDFTAVDGQWYYIYVTGFSTNTGDYTLSITCQDLGGADDCGFPELLCGDAATGSTVGAGTADAPPTCGTALNSSGGVWYAFQGIGDVVTVTTCNPGTDFDTKMGVFTGACDNMICIAGNDDGSPLGINPDAACVIPSTGSTFNRASTITFTALAGQYYYIYVTGFSTNEGNYEVSIDCNVTRDGGAGTSLNVAQNAASEVKEFEVSDFYPNPASTGASKVQIMAPNNATGAVTMFDQLGRQVYSNSRVELFAGHNVLEVPFGNLAAGTYFVNIRIDDQNFRKKVVVANN